MNILKEFFESSSIHGLVYISSAKVSLWTPLVLVLVSRPSQSKFSGYLLSALVSSQLES